MYFLNSNCALDRGSLWLFWCVITKSVILLKVEHQFFCLLATFLLYKVGDSRHEPIINTTPSRIDINFEFYDHLTFFILHPGMQCWCRANMESNFRQRLMRTSMRDLRHHNNDESRWFFVHENCAFAGIDLNVILSILGSGECLGCPDRNPILKASSERWFIKQDMCFV